MQPLDPLARLVRGLDLEPIGRDSFRARTGASAERLFGGLLLSQAAIASGRTVEGRHLHSLHASFLRPGRSRLPLALAIERLRDGRSFSARRGTGRQGHDVTIVATASFTQPANGIAHQDRMPDAPSPEGLPDWEDLRARVLGTERREDVAVELRVCDADPELGAKGLPAYRRVWIRPKGQLSDDPLLHAAMFVFASDRTLLRVAARPHGAIWSSGTRRAWTTPSGFIMSAGSTTGCSTCARARSPPTAARSHTAPCTAGTDAASCRSRRKASSASEIPARRCRHRDSEEAHENEHTDHRERESHFHSDTENEPERGAST